MNDYQLLPSNQAIAGFFLALILLGIGIGALIF